MASLADLLEGMGVSDEDFEAFYGFQMPTLTEVVNVDGAKGSAEDGNVMSAEDLEDETMDHALDLAAEIELEIDYGSIREVSGSYVATAYVLAKNCIFALQEEGHDTLLEAIAREAIGAMSQESQVAFCEKGL